MEEQQGVLSISVFDDNPWTDVEEYDPAVVVVTTGVEELGERLCEQLTGAFWNVRHKAVVHITPISEAIKRVKLSDGGPTVLIESGDLIGGGGAGDGVAVLDALLKAGITRIATVVYAPIAVFEAYRVGSGRELKIDVGGKHEYGGAFPLRFEGHVAMLFDGKFSLKGIPYEGINAFLGKTAVISAGDMDIVLTSKQIHPQGSAVFDALNLGISDKKVISLKGYSAGAERPAFEFPVQDVIEVDTPGWTVWDFHAVPHRKIPRPIYPLDPIETGCLAG